MVILIFASGVRLQREGEGGGGAGRPLGSVGRQGLEP